MAEKSGFFNSSNGDRKYKAEFFAEYFASFIANGVFPNPSTGLQVTANNDMTVTIKPGKGWINGYYYSNDSDIVLSVDVADGVLKRIDRVVLTYGLVDRVITVGISKGAFASSPVAPALQRDADIYELGLADIYIANGAVSISQANITDLRLNNELCGIVHGTVDQVDTTTLFNQYLDWHNTKQVEFNTNLTNYTTTKQNEINTWFTDTQNTTQTDLDNMEAQFLQDWNTWFASVQAVLDGDTAGNLLNMINDLAGEGRTTETVKGNADSIGTLANLTTTDKTNLVGAVNEIVSQQAETVPKGGTWGDLKGV